MTPLGSTPAECLLGLDIGTTNTKAALVEVADGRAPRLVHLASLPTPDEVDGLRGVVDQVIDRVLESARAEGSTTTAPRVAAVAIASMAETGAALDSAGDALTELIGWRDTRAVAEADQLRAEAPAIFAATGVRLSAKPPLAKWRWLTHQAPGVRSRMATWAGVADLAALHLTDRLATDHTLAGRTGAYRLWAEAGTSGWDADILDLAGLTLEQLPPVLAPGDAVGAISATAQRPGLPAGVPVFIAGHDHAVGAHGAGVRGAGQVADSLGTAEALYTVIADTPALRSRLEPMRAAGLSLVRTAGGAALALVGGIPAAGALVGWLGELLGPDRLDAALTNLTDRWEQGCPTPAHDLPRVLPYLSGRQAPAPDAAARLSLAGLGAPDSSESVADAVLLALAFAARWIAEESARLGGGGIESVSVLGGPTRNAAWMARKAAACPWATRLVREPEAVALGAACLAAERAGLADGPATVPAEPMTITHDPAYDPVFARFVHAATQGELDDPH